MYGCQDVCMNVYIMYNVKISMILQKSCNTICHYFQTNFRVELSQISKGYAVTWINTDYKIFFKNFYYLCVFT